MLVKDRSCAVDKLTITKLQITPDKYLLQVGITINSDGVGLQLSIVVGLDPNRTSNFNTSKYMILVLMF
jgi:hypothetical protein